MFTQVTDDGVVGLRHQHGSGLMPTAETFSMANRPPGGFTTDRLSIDSGTSESP
jgi:hypothetical protein